MNRVYRAMAMASPPIAAVIVLVAGAITPGYDPASLTISRLAIPGKPAALAVDFAMLLVALTCFSLASALVPGARLCRAALSISGVAFIVAAVIHLDPASPGTSALHRIASGIAVLGLGAAPLLLSGGYRRISLAAGVAEAALLLSAPILNATSFNAWGVWQRVLLALALSWIVVIAATMPSADDTARARAATVRSSGT